MTIQPDEQTYMIDLTNLSEDQRQILGDEVLQELEKYVVVPSQAFTHIYGDYSRCDFNPPDCQRKNRGLSGDSEP